MSCCRRSYPGITRFGFAGDKSRAGDSFAVQAQGLVRKISDITDGTSKTVAIGENIPDCYNWSNWIYGDTNNFSASNGINVLMSTCCNSLGGDWTNYIPCRGFKSMHPGGINTLFADGSVQFVAQEIDINLFQQLSTIAGGEVAALNP